MGVVPTQARAVTQRLRKAGLGDATRAFRTREICRAFAGFEACLSPGPPGVRAVHFSSAEAAPVYLPYIMLRWAVRHINGQSLKHHNDPLAHFADPRPLFAASKVVFTKAERVRANAKGFPTRKRTLVDRVVGGAFGAVGLLHRGGHRALAGRGDGGAHPRRRRRLLRLVSAQAVRRAPTPREIDQDLGEASRRTSFDPLFASFTERER